MSKRSALPQSESPARRRRRGSGAITLSDVARIAGVSPITASRALNTPASVSPETLERVRGAVSRTGYVPNRVAGGLASSRSRLVAAVVPTVVGPVFQPTIQALTEALEQAGYQLMLGQGGYGDSREDALLEAIIGRRPDGIVLTGVVHSATARRRLVGAGIPIVETWDITPTPLDMLVGFSHERAGAAVAEYLAGRGYRRLAILHGDDDRALRRAAAFTDAASRAEATCTRHSVPAPGTLGSGRSGLTALLAQDPTLDAVWCSSDVLALGVLLESHARGMRVPEDLAVVGFGDMDFARDAYPALSTVRIDGAAIGRQAARFIVERLNGADTPPPIVDIGFSITERAST